jgi:hypothetical protein
VPNRDIRDDEQPDQPRSTRRRLLLGNLAKIAHPPFTTPQWNDALREQEARGTKKPKRDD